MAAFWLYPLAVLETAPRLTRLRAALSRAATERTTMNQPAAVPCNAAQLHRFGDLSSEHGPHEWIVQPGMPAVRCPGTAASSAGQAPAAQAEAVLRVVETAVGDTLVDSARNEALAGIAAVLYASAPVDQAALVARTVRACADH